MQPLGFPPHKQHRPPGFRQRRPRHQRGNRLPLDFARFKDQASGSKAVDADTRPQAAAGRLRQRRSILGRVGLFGLARALDVKPLHARGNRQGQLGSGAQADVLPGNLQNLDLTARVLVEPPGGGAPLRDADRPLTDVADGGKARGPPESDPHTAAGDHRPEPAERPAIRLAEREHAEVETARRGDLVDLFGVRGGGIGRRYGLDHVQK